MREQYYDKLKKEIIFIQNKSRSVKTYKYQPWQEADSYEYFVILSSGVHFYIAPGSTTLPEFQENDIVYIRKKISDDEFEDTELGCITVDSVIFYDNMIRKLFNISRELEFDTGCYD